MADIHSDREQRLRERAHKIWEDDGRPEGREREHWQRAVAELEGEDDVRGQRAAGDFRPGQPGGGGRDGAGISGDGGQAGIRGAGSRNDHQGSGSK